ncbi:pyrroloquinoline quinone biosynthesis peptide chaperone PqqD [Shewanella woodyi]|jgi:pyrroloquinoline quinone biosynthesis protein D|uniref:PqqA binding protein n=1 Tax=Shewanella woodyi (strain ATCC 51908 / MS32) TaxID=392500 RepID=B1KEF3_SHEWM|nr:pyrroloquinoline quinone biosynthesis peptide chaperone PqqD [Shewanella woodyi]ACA86531.1 coenzyme PQQ synthesis D [Shewanella woodyi ATCC 51908]
MTLTVPKMNPLFRLQFEKAQGCFVLLYPEGMVKLNESAAEILQLVDGSASVDEIHKQLQHKFPQAGDIRHDIEEFLLVAQEKRWISYV